MGTKQHEVDQRNAQFWNELCGSNLAHSLGVTETTPEGLRRFDAGYFAFYPYLSTYVTSGALSGKRVLEIGLGYGSLGQLIIEQGAYYHGIDIAANAALMIRYRQHLMSSACTAVRGSVLDLPYGGAVFDCVYSVGCIHHTGDPERAIDEVHRVLKPGGMAVIMLYHRHSFRRLIQIPLQRMLRGLLGKQRHLDRRADERAMYDQDTAGAPAPQTDFISRGSARRLFGRFSRVKVDIHNFDPYAIIPGRLVLKREWFLGNLDRILGLDLYITAVK